MVGGCLGFVQQGMKRLLAGRPSRISVVGGSWPGQGAASFLSLLAPLVSEVFDMIGFD